MNSTLKKIAYRVLGRHGATLSRIRWNIINRRGVASYGQEGEDRVLASLLVKLHGGTLPLSGFFVDVGAHDPYRFSNTFFFYKRGWTGINIDAAPGSMRNFTACRPRDLNLEVGVGSTRTAATFYVFNEPALNTFDTGLASTRNVAPWRITREVEVQILPLRDIFASHVAPGQSIDFLTIDVEGRDIDVLHSNDWAAYRPKVVVIEILGKSMEEAILDPVAKFLSDNGYSFYSKTVNTTFFIDVQLRSAR